MDYLFNAFSIFCGIIGCLGLGWLIYGTIFPTDKRQRGTWNWSKLVFYAALIALSFA